LSVSVPWRLAHTRLVTWSGHVRLILCLLQAVQELQALGLCRLYSLRRRVALGLHASGPVSIVSIISQRYSPVTFVCTVGGRGVAVRARGRRRCWPTRRATPRWSRAACLGTMPHRNQHASYISRPPPTMHPPPFRDARTVAFCRFAGRPSPSPAAALEALRFAALSMSIDFVVA
jgi:hypothetical protein